MGLAYRALWNDDRADLHSAVSKTFLYWASDFPSRHDRLQISEPFVLDTLEVEADGSQVCAARVTVYNEEGSLSVNVSTFCCQEDQQILVEADLEAGDSLEPYRNVVPLLIRDLIDDGVSDGGRPRGGVLEISAGAQPVFDSGELDGLVDQIDDPNRTVGLVLLMADLLDFNEKRKDRLVEAGVEETQATLQEITNVNQIGRGRAELLAGFLAGVAVVKWIPYEMVSAAQRKFDPVFAGNGESTSPESEEESEDWRLSLGRVRVYPVGIGAEDRSRTYHETIVRERPGVLVDEIRSAIEPGLIGLRLPDGLLAARLALELEVALVQDQEIHAPPSREVEFQDTSELVAQLREDLEKLRQILPVRELEVQELREVNAQLLEDLEVRRQEVDEVHNENERLISQLVSLLSRQDDSLEVGQPKELLKNVSHVVRLARADLPLVDIPEAALRDVQHLDSGINARSDAKKVWKGLLALHCYAQAQAGERTYRDFEQWCKRSRHVFAWSSNPQKLAMNESNSVKRDPLQRSARQFPISPEVDPSGKMEMFPHLKISTGSQHATRLYFYDDTSGPTGRIHIGFIGPHKQVPNSTT